MDANDSLITRLMAKYARHEALTAEELRTLENWWKASSDNMELAKQFGNEEWVREAVKKLNSVPKREMWAEITRQLDEMDAAVNGAGTGFQPKKSTGRLATLAWSLSAAALVLCTVWLIVKQERTKPGKAPTTAKTENTPVIIAKRDAIWIDSTGHSVPLGSLPVGSIISTIGANILRKVDTNALAYDALADKKLFLRPSGSNMLTTGSESSPYHLQLSDGSAVWLSSGARFIYSNNSRDNEHPYTLVGKAFFDIAKAGGKPFVIDLLNGNRIRVTGTEFSAESYAQKPDCRVALVSGSLNLTTNKDSVQLSAGEEAIGHSASVEKQKIKDPAAVTGWIGKSLSFHFDNTDFETALAQVASWYGLKVSNPHNLKGTAIMVDLPRPSSPEPILKSIAKLQSHFVQMSFQNNEIVVSNWRGTK